MKSLDRFPANGRGRFTSILKCSKTTAGLNFGDCFSYALARASGEALLFQGEDFSRTDISAADPGPAA